MRNVEIRNFVGGGCAAANLQPPNFGGGGVIK
jgi:hypothetical protein